MWDPDGRGSRVGVHIAANVTDELCRIIQASKACDVDTMDDDGDNDVIAAKESRTELDSHANMAVVGKHAHVISDTGQVADVNPFTPDYQSMAVRIVDAAVKYECPFTGNNASL